MAYDWRQDAIASYTLALRYIAWEQKEGDEPHLIARAALEGK